MRKWTLSQYTAEIRASSGDLLLHNSFMGAIARIAPDKVRYMEPFLKDGIDDADLTNPHLKELCDGGFFVSSEIDERKAVAAILRRERELGFSVFILPHENCNFRCVYCYETFERGKMNQNIVKGLKILIERKAKEKKPIAVSWFGGEPLLAKDVIYDLSDSFIRSCQDNKVPYNSSMTTNGFFLSPDVFDNLLERSVRIYQVTVDGSEKLHNKTRFLVGGQGTYRKIMDNLADMRKSKKDFSVRIRVNFNDETISHIDEFLTELAQLFRGDRRFHVDFASIGKWGGPNDSKLQVCNAESVWLKNLQLEEKAIKYGLSNRTVTERLTPHKTACYAGKESSIVVRSDGKICKCTVALEDPRNHVGRITENGELIIDKYLWDMWVKLDDKDDNKCGSCSYNPCCESRACPLIAIDQREPPCPVTKEEYESYVKLAAFGNLDDLIKEPKMLTH